VDPSSLGVVRDPGSYQADLACGDLQPLGQHLTFGGSASGFMSCRLDEALLTALPNIYLAAVPTVRPGEYDYFWGNFDSTSYGTRGTSDDVIGCGSTMAGIVAAVYLSLMGPVGLAELGEALRARAEYLGASLEQIPGVSSRRLSGVPFKEVVVDFSQAGRTVPEVNALLLKRGIFGGISLENDFPDLAGCALFSVTEEHTREDLDRLTTTVEDLLR
jgi:glycine dehydrogenase subunit 1